jgi:hypothetical protein
MINHTREPQLLGLAKEIGCPTAYEDLFDAQLSYWISIKTLMLNSGYLAVQKRMPSISRELADSIAAASIQGLRKLCTAQMSTLRPSLPDDTIQEIISSEATDTVRSKMALQLLAQGEAS